MMTRLLVIIAAVTALAVTAPAQSSFVTTAAALRTTASLTTSDVYSTATLPATAKAVHFFVEFDKGAATNATFTPVGAMNGNPLSTGYFKVIASAKTLTVSDRITFTVPRADFGAFQYFGIVSVGTGTLTSSGAKVSVKYEY